MRVLLVDGDPKSTKTLVSALQDLDWEAQSAKSGKEALAVLARGGVHVLISEARLLDMDGAELLGKVRESFPDIVRVVLTADGSLETAVRAMAVAHQFLAKPCKAEIARDLVMRTQVVLRLMNQPELRALVGGITELPATPKMYTELTKVINRKNSSIGDVAAVVERDAAMSAKALQLVNSSFFSKARTIDTVQQAVNRLGIDMMKSLALVTGAFEGGKVREPGLKRFLEEEQSHALAVGMAARQLCTDRRRGEQAFMSGVLHDIGKVVLRVGSPTLASDVRTAMKRAKQGACQHDVETQVLGVSHAEVGAYLAGLWGLPFVVVEAIAQHHQPVRMTASDGMEAAVAVHIADTLLKKRTLDSDLLADLGVEGDIADWRDRVGDLIEK